MVGMNLVFLIEGENILLALKKRGFGEGLWNGVGGKSKSQESVIEAAKRECLEEIFVTPIELSSVARFKFTSPDNDDLLVDVFFCQKWDGEPKESEEMRPQWFNVEDIPFDQMWPDDSHWLPRVLAGEKLEGTFNFDSNNNLLDFDLKSVETL